MFHYRFTQEQEPRAGQVVRSLGKYSIWVAQQQARKEPGRQGKQEAPGFKRSWKRQGQAESQGVTKMRNKRRQMMWDIIRGAGTRRVNQRRGSQISASACLKERLRESQGGVYPSSLLWSPIIKQMPTSFPFYVFIIFLKQLDFHL